MIVFYDGGRTITINTRAEVRPHKSEHGSLSWPMLRVRLREMLTTIRA
jgi:hypothetical protein